MVVRNSAVQVERDHHGQPGLHIIADSATWVSFLRKESSLLWTILRGQLRWRGDIRQLITFGKCFGA